MENISVCLNIGVSMTCTDKFELIYKNASLRVYPQGRRCLISRVQWSMPYLLSSSVAGSVGWKIEKKVDYKFENRKNSWKGNCSRDSCGGNIIRDFVFL